MEDHADLCRQLPLLVRLAGDLFPALGSRDLNRVMQLIGQGVLIFAVQKLAQFGQDALLAGPALQVSQRLRRDVQHPAACGAGGSGEVVRR